MFTISQHVLCLLPGSHGLRLGETYLWKDGDAEGLIGDLTHEVE